MLIALALLRGRFFTVFLNALRHRSFDRVTYLPPLTLSVESHKTHGRA